MTWLQLLMARLHRTAQVSSWDQWRPYLDIDTSALIDKSASVMLFDPPAATKTQLSIGADSHIFSTFNLMTSQAEITIGKRCQLGKVNFIAAKKIVVGNDVIMAWGITIMDNDSHALRWQDRKQDVKQSYEDYQRYGNIVKHKNWEKVAMKPIIIEDRAWIGFNASILKGVTIGKEAVIGAGSVVTKDIPAFSVVAGNPARIVKTLR